MKTKHTFWHTFRWLNLTQAIGSFQDNLFKMLTICYLSTGLGLNLVHTLELTTLLLVAPFLIFSNLAGALADHYSKSRLIHIVKAAELGLLLLAFPAYLSGRAWPMLLILTLLASQSAFFGPLKRGIIPECIPEHDIAEANARMTSASYLGIIAGMVLPSVLLTILKVRYLGVLILSLVLSCIGLIASFGIARTKAQRRRVRVSMRVFSDTARAFHQMRPRKLLREAALGGVIFTGIAAFFQQVLVVYAKHEAGLSVEASGFAFLFVAAGIAIGSRLSGHYSARLLDLGSIPAGIALTGIGFLGLAATSRIVFQIPLLLIIGLGGGLCLVPMTATLQTASETSHRGEVLGASETASFGAIILSAGLFHIATDALGLSARGMMLLAGLASLVFCVAAIRTLPAETVRFGLTRLVRLLYRVRVEGEENIPLEGGAMLAMNHTAFCDAPVAQSVLPRKLRFIMSREVFTTWAWCRPIFRASGAIQIHASDSARELVRAISSAREALRSGELLGICPEGALTTTGHIEEFRPGLERMLRGTEAPVIPIYIGNLWGSMFSFARGNPGLKFPSHILHRRRILIRIGKPLPTDSTASQIRDAVLALQKMP